MRNHIFGQLFGAEGCYLILCQCYAIAQHRKCMNLIANLIIGNQDDRGLLNRGMAVERRLDLAQFNAIAAALNLIVATAQIGIIAVGFFSHQNTGAIDRFGPQMLMNHIGRERLCRAFRQSPITVHQPRPAHTEFAHLARRYNLILLVKHKRLAVGARLAI